jgi:hypothetical protein
VIRRDDDPSKEQPVADVVVTASNGTTSVSARSDASGYFQISYPQILWPGRTVNLSFRHPDYMPFDLTLQSGLRLTTRELYVAALSALPQKSPATTNSATTNGKLPNGKLSVVSNVRVRYTVNSESVNNIGSAANTFQIVNQRNIPCSHQLPCSPDGAWKAKEGSVSLDAGPGNEFRDVRASCIAGPCPFTKIDSSGFAQGGRKITASAIDWSDTATFLVEAEVFHDAINSNVREIYPVIFGQTLHFTLPPTQEGVSLEAEIDGTPMVFPLGPELYLSWASCTQRSSPDAEKTAVYRCELKPGYRF